MPKATVNGIEIFYEVHGQGEPLLMVMGINAQSIHWPPEFVAQLVNVGFQVITFDNRDVGLSTDFGDLEAPSTGSLIGRRLFGLSVKPPYTLSDMANDGFELLTELGIDSAHILGASMGGMIAQQMAIQQPERVRSLTSIMSHTGQRRHFIAKPHAVQALMGPSPKTAEEAGQRVLDLMHIIGSPQWLRTDEEYRLLGATAHERGSSPEGFKRQLAAIMASKCRDEELADLSVPVLVIHGEVDPLILPAGGKHTASVIPHARLLMIDGMGHDLPLPKLPEMVQALKDMVGL
jgi:pimeloyl-ACP methyl ester carboxylesterase